MELTNTHSNIDSYDIFNELNDILNKIEANEHIHSTNVDNRSTSNYAKCRLVRKILPYFYKNIDIEYKCFVNNEYNLLKCFHTILIENSFTLLTNNFFCNSEKNYLSETKNIYVEHIKQIFDLINSDNIPNDVRKIYANKKYKLISPLYIYNTYSDIYNMVDLATNPSQQILNDVYTNLDRSLTQLKKYTRQIKHKFTELLNKHTLYLLTHDKYDYELNNEIGSLILDVCNYLIMNGWYGIYSILFNIFGFYLYADKSINNLVIV